MLLLKKLSLVVMAICASSTTVAATAVDQLLREYQSQGASLFNADQGKLFWNKKSTARTGESRSCSTCHTSNVKQYGKHATTGKEIKPLAPSVIGKRLTNPKKISKWFRRNCSWVLGRECSAQEKGNVLMYLKDQ